MIDKYKREKAARQISEKVADANGFDDSKPTHIAFLEGHIDGFNAGAKWAINEFLKDLWHPASEEPREFAEVLAEAKITESIKTYISFKRNDTLFKNWMLIVRVLILLVGCILMIYFQRKEVSNERGWRKNHS